ncbi:MAG: hypothetical protein V4565_05395 [Bacteroidota bacterium]
MNNQFADIYKKLPTAKLLEIIENKKDYELVAIDAVKQELAIRHDIDDAKIEMKVKAISKEQQDTLKNQRRQDIKEKTFKALEFADPLVEKTPDRAIVVLSILLLIAFVYKTATSLSLISYVIQNLSEIDFSGLTFLIEFIYLPLTILFFWRKTKRGWTMLLVWLVYQGVLDCFGLYMCYELAGIDNLITQLMPMPNSSNYIFMLALHCGLIYFICKPTIRVLFEDKEPQATSEMI